VTFKEIRSYQAYRLNHVMPKELSKNLLNLLVQEFRLWQELARLTRMERRALVESDALLLYSLIEQKGEHLSALAESQHSRHALLETIKASSWPSDRSPSGRISLTFLLEQLDPADADCLLHIADGILSLADQVGELAQGNFALADCALRRFWVLQTWIKQEEYHSLPALLSSLLSDHEVLNPQESTDPPLKTPEPPWSQPLDFVDRDIFSDMLASRSYISNAENRP
jgi:FlgN protein